MADENTPADKPAAAADKPAPRRRAARKPAAEGAPARQPRKAKPKADETASAPAAAAPAPSKRRAPPKPRAAKRPTPSSRPRKKSDDQSAVSKATDKVGGKWGAAAIAGGIAVAGAAAAALLTLRGSSAKDGDFPVDPAGGAHQPDGTDSSASFKAGIADESTIPDKS